MIGFCSSGLAIFSFTTHRLLWRNISALFRQLWKNTYTVEKGHFMHEWFDSLKAKSCFLYYTCLLGSSVTLQGSILAYSSLVNCMGHGQIYSGQDGGSYIGSTSLGMMLGVMHTWLSAELCACWKSLSPSLAASLMLGKKSQAWAAPCFTDSRGGWKPKSKKNTKQIYSVKGRLLPKSKDGESLPNCMLSCGYLKAQIHF